MTRELDIATGSRLIPHTLIRRVEADGVTVFYREARATNASTNTSENGNRRCSQSRESTTFTLFPQAPNRSDATVQFLDTGHFALETHLEEIALAMRDFLGRLPPDEPRSKEVTAVIDEAASLLSRTNVK